jgi:hypothetical protein
LGNAKTIAPEQKDKTLESADYSKDYILMIHSDGINNTLSKYNLNTKKTAQVKLPFSGTIKYSLPQH